MCRPKWKNNIKIDFEVVRYEVIDWVHVYQARKGSGTGYCGLRKQYFPFINGREFYWRFPLYGAGTSLSKLSIIFYDYPIDASNSYKHYLYSDFHPSGDQTLFSITKSNRLILLGK
jgi:hypothetical protein